MKSLSRISAIFIVFTFVFASENNSTIAGENTDVNNTDSNIPAIDSEVLPTDVEKINEYLNENGVVIIPGFQGISKSADITTIGRGGSDATAVAISKLLNADKCEIYTDVDGVYSTDPNKIPVAKKIDKISYENF